MVKLGHNPVPSAFNSSAEKTTDGRLFCLCMLSFSASTMTPSQTKYLRYYSANPVASIAPTAYIIWQNFVNSYQIYRRAK